MTSQAIFSDEHCKAKIIAKTDGVFAGETVIREGFGLLHNDIRIRSLKKDGERMKKEDVLAEMEGPAAALLTGERVILNLIQRMSGIATMTDEPKGVLMIRPLSFAIREKRHPDSECWKNTRSESEAAVIIASAYMTAS